MNATKNRSPHFQGNPLEMRCLSYLFTQFFYRNGNLLCCGDSLKIDVNNPITPTEAVFILRLILSIELINRIGMPCGIVSFLEAHSILFRYIPFIIIPV